MKLSDKVLEAGHRAFFEPATSYGTSKIAFQAAFLAMLEAMKEEGTAEVCEHFTWNNERIIIIRTDQ